MILVGVLVGVTLLRTSSFHDSAKVLVIPVEGLPPLADQAAYVRSLAEDPKALLYTTLSAGFTISRRALRESMRFSRARRSIVVRVEAGSPARVRSLVRALMPQMAGASAREVRRTAKNRASTLRLQLRSPLLSHRERARVARLLGLIQPITSGKTLRVAFRPLGPPPRPTRWIDRAIAKLPGDYPPAPSPILAGIAGVIAALIVAATSLALWRRGSASAAT